MAPPLVSHGFGGDGDDISALCLLAALSDESRRLRRAEVFQALLM